MTNTLPSGAGAERTVYLRNCWYVAGWAEDISRTPLRRVILDEPVALYRKEDGTPVAMGDFCPHRFVPLSMGRLVGDDIECAYHGLRFNPAGACTLNPHGNGAIPAAARVKTFPLHERYGAVWIWTGAPSLNDPALIPTDFAILDDPAFTSVRGVLHVEANYQLIIDNLLDLSHAQFLHPGLRVANPKRMRNEMKQENGKVIAYFWRDEGEPNALMRLLGWPAGTLGDTRAHMHWSAPSQLYLDVGATGVGRPESEGISAPSMHLLTPETANTTLYFFAFLRNVRIDDAEFSERVRAIGMQAFAGEDKPIVEAQQRQIGGGDIMRLSPVLLPSDGAATRARRALQARLDAERAALAPASAERAREVSPA